MIERMTEFSPRSNVIEALQRKLGTGVDGVVSNPSAMVKQLQRNLNAGKLW